MGTLPGKDEIGKIKWEKGGIVVCGMKHSA
jgi:hypothetical protein